MSDDTRLAATTARIPILAYHSIDGGASPMSMPAARFREHMQSLHDEGWRTLSLADLLNGHVLGAWPGRSVVLTFDDGIANVGEHALPLLARFGFSAILFAVSARLGGATDWPGWPSNVPTQRLLDAPAFRDAADSGVEIGAHSVSHPRLSRLSPEAAEREIVDSQARLEDVIGRPVRCFAYPFGDAPPSATAVVERHFAAGFGIDLAYASPRSRVSTFERIDAYYLRGRARLTDLERPSTRVWLATRAVLRRARRVSGYGQA
jgi:peptidoglycan/xylan/chitin deacetylase (PgdA/CDA1 family)